MNAQLLSQAEQEIEQVLRIRRERSQLLGPGLFSDPAWDMLLQLSEARLKHRPVRLRDLVADSPRSTIARWAAVLEERGLITAKADALVPAVPWIELSDRAAAAMSRLLKGAGQWQATD